MSFDAYETIKSTRKGDISVMITGGSYNAGNQPQYGKEWENYVVAVVKWKGQHGTNIEEEIRFRNMPDAEWYFNKMVEKYLGDTKSNPPLVPVSSVTSDIYKDLNNIESIARNLKFERNNVSAMKTGYSDLTEWMAYLQLDIQKLSEQPQENISDSELEGRMDAMIRFWDEMDDEEKMDRYDITLSEAQGDIRELPEDVFDAIYEDMINSY